jgi:hypothetical protein
LAITARTTQLTAVLLALSKSWEELAIELEDSFARRLEAEALRTDVRNSLSETKRLSDLLDSKR